MFFFFLITIIQLRTATFSILFLKRSSTAVMLSQCVFPVQEPNELYWNIQNENTLAAGGCGEALRRDERRDRQTDAAEKTQALVEVTAELFRVCTRSS